MSTLKDYRVLGQIGRGSYGVVHKVQNIHDKKIYVLKQVDISKLDVRSKKQAQAEANILKQIRSPYIVQYYHSFLEKGNLNIIMEFCSGGDLDKFLKRMMGRPIKEEQIWKFFIEMCIGLRDIHHKRILHRDIKAMNIFLTQDENIRIGDLGVAKELKQDFARTIVGTPYYLSPEMCEERPYNEKTDIWALGCVLYQMCTGRYPFEAKNQASLALKIITGKYSPISNHYSTDMSEMIHQCLSVDHKRRPSASYILEKHFVKNFIQTKKIQTSADRNFEKQRPEIVGNTVHLQVNKLNTPKTPTIAQQHFWPATDHNDQADNIQSIKVAKWEKPRKSEEIKVPEFLQHKLELKNIPTPNAGRKSAAELISLKIEQQPISIGALHSPSQKNIPKSPQINKNPFLKDPKEQKKAKQEQRKEELRLQKEKYDQKMKDFKHKKQQEVKQKARLAQQKKKEYQMKLKQAKNNKLKQPKEEAKHKHELREEQRHTQLNHNRSVSEPAKPYHNMPSVENKKQKVTVEKMEVEVEEHYIIEEPDSDEEKYINEQPDKMARVVHLIQAKVNDEELLDQFGIVGEKAKPQKNEQTGKFFELKSTKELNWQESHGIVKHANTLPIFVSNQLHEPQQTIVCEYDPNEIMEQLEEVQPYQSSVESAEHEEENVYLIKDQTGQDKQNLNIMLQENTKRKEMLSKLIHEKEEQLYTKLPKGEYIRLKKIINECDQKSVEIAFKNVQAFHDQKVLYLFYKIMLYDSQVEECNRTIKQINVRFSEHSPSR